MDLQYVRECSDLASRLCTCCATEDICRTDSCSPVNSTDLAAVQHKVFGPAPQCVAAIPIASLAPSHSVRCCAAGRVLVAETALARLIGLLDGA